jgi:hypothetical protein
MCVRCFFGLVGLFLLIIALVLGYPIIKTYYELGLVPRFPTAILATGLVLLGSLSFTCGLILTVSPMDGAAVSPLALALAVLNVEFLSRQGWNRLGP